MTKGIGSSDKRYKERPISFYAPNLNRFGNVPGPLLDMGCGHGHLLLLAKERGIEAYGIEYSKSRVELCKTKGLDVILHDLCKKLPFPNDFFGMVYCGQVIEHVPPQGQKNIVDEAFRVLKKDGILQIRSPNKNNKESRKPGHEYLLTMRELRGLLLSAGFRKPDFSLNYPKSFPYVPDLVIKYIWKCCRSDILSASTNAIAVKK